MEKFAIDHLEGLYKDEINSHELKKVINNIDLISYKINGIQDKKKLSSKNPKYINESIPISRNSLTFKNKLRKDSSNLKTFKPKEENIFVYSNSDDSKKEEEQINNIKKKRINDIKPCKTFKNCGENINKAKYLFFNKANSKPLLDPAKKFSTKNCLSSNKRRMFLQTTKRHRKLKDKTKENGKLSPNKIETDNLFKKKKPYYKTNYSNNKIILFKNNIISEFQNENNENSKGSNKINNNNKQNKDNKENSIIIINQFRMKAKNSNGKLNLKSYSNNHRKKSFNEKSKQDSNNIVLKNLKSNVEIINDTDNEVENNILCLLDKSFKKKRNSVLSKKNNHYGTMELFNDNFIKNFHSSVDNKKIKNTISNDIGKISNSHSISIIKKTELNHFNMNDKDEDFEDSFFFGGQSGQIKHQFKHMLTQKVEAFGYKDKDNDENLFLSSNKSLKNKEEKKYIIYNNINYFKNTQRDEKNLEDNQNNSQINKEVKNDNVNENNNKLSKRCGSSFFNCCFLLD